MTTICRSISVAVLGIAAAAGAARAADATLLVAVEVAPGVDVGPADVRQIVATELGTPVIGSRESTADGASDVLLVVLDPREIRMSLRAGAGPVVSRTISAPPDRPGRLKSIGWLAGNMVRDQVGPIVGGREAAPAVAAGRPATEAPVRAQPPPASAAVPEAVVASSRSSRGEGIAHSTWAITAGGGPTVQMLFWNAAWPDMLPGGTVYHVEVHRQASPDSLLLGVALEAGPAGDQTRPHYLGAAPFVGSSWSSRRWFIEGTLGLGLEALVAPVKGLTVTNNSTTGAVSETTTSFEPVPGLYARLQGTGGLHVSQAFDLVAQLGAHLSSTGQFGSYLSSTIGLRLRLP